MPWYGDPKTGVMIGVIEAKKKGLSVWTVPRSQKELQGDIDRIRLATEEAHKLIRDDGGRATAKTNP